MMEDLRAAGLPRRAALLVHAMPALDRHWLLGKLPLPQRSRLQVLLAELGELGIPADEQLLHDVLDAAPPPSPATPATMLERLTGAQIPALAAVLRAEPPQLVAGLLAARPWPWADTLLREIGPEAAQHIRQAQPLRGALAQQAICASAWRAVQAQRQERAATPMPAWRKLALRWQGGKP